MSMICNSLRSVNSSFGLRIKSPICSMRVHYMLNHQWGNFKCELCHYFAYYSTDFAYHVLTMHGGGGDGEGDAKMVTATCPECELAVPGS